MRISDWSSDVCSSDLRAKWPHRRGSRTRRNSSGGQYGQGASTEDADRRAARQRGDGQRMRQEGRSGEQRRRRNGEGRRAPLAERHDGDQRSHREEQHPDGDRRDQRGARKRVVWGKSVTVGVKRGGRRKIKKKKQ